VTTDPVESAEGLPEAAPDSDTAYTLLFSEIDDATQLWELNPEAMAAAVRGYHTLIADAAEAHAGRTVTQLGDYVHAVFDTAGDAVRCAIETQVELLDRNWAGLGRLRARMGLHTGLLQVSAGDVFGPGVAVAARLQTAANGGQILLSEETALASRSSLLSGERLDPVGRQALLGLPGDLVVYQVVSAQLTAAGRPLRLGHSGYEDLPQEQTRLIGRDQLVIDLLQLVREERLVTLWGPAGVGKTRTAVRVAARSRSPFSDGVRFVDLSVTQDAAQVLDVILGVLHGAPATGEQPEDTTIRVLSPARLLLVLDNCEHVLERVRRLVISVIDRCPWVHILATSREQLNLGSEHRVEVTPLEVPPASVGNASVILSSAAVRLFVDRARLASGDFELTPDNAPAVAEICRRVGGLPLGIELAAGRLDVETPDELAGHSVEAGLLNRLERQLVRSGGVRNVVEPYTWAFDHLSATEQLLFLSLSTFTGPFTREMAFDLVNATGGIDEVTAFDRLVRSSMVTRESAGSPRFRLFEPAREFARSRLDSAELDALRSRHAALMLARAQLFGPLIRTEQEARAVEVLRADFADHRQAFSWLLGGGRVDEAAELTVALFQFCHFQLLAEAYEWPKQLSELVSTDSPLFVDIRGAAALGAWFEGDPDESIRLAEDVVRRAPASRRRSLFWAQTALIDSFGYAGRLGEAAEYFMNFITDTAQSGEPFWQILGLGYEAISFLLFGRTEEALIRAERAAALARQLNNPDCSHWALHCLGRSLVETDLEAACQAFEEAIDATRRVGSRFNMSLNLVEWAGLKRQLDDPRSAAQALLELLDLLVGAGNRSQLAQAFFESARLLMDEGVVELAFLLVEGRLGLPEMPKARRAAAGDEAFVTKLRSVVGDQRARLSVRARGLTEQDLVILCRSGLEDIARGRLPSERRKTRRLEDVAIVYTDLVASTELNVRVGDDQFVHLLREHNMIVRRRLRRFAGTEFTFTGDGVGAMFSHVHESLLFAIGLQADLDNVNSAHPTSPLRVRVGIARGEALENEGNLFGQTVVRAVRVCAAAGAGQVLAGEDVTITADPAVATFSPVGHVPLKGFGTSVLLYQVSTPQDSLLTVP